MDRHDYLPTVADGDPSVAEDAAYATAVDEEGPPPERITESDLSQMDWDPRESLDDPHE